MTNPARQDAIQPGNEKSIRPVSNKMLRLSGDKAIPAPETKEDGK